MGAGVNELRVPFYGIAVAACGPIGDICSEVDSPLMSIYALLLNCYQVRSGEAPVPLPQVSCICETGRVVVFPMHISNTFSVVSCNLHGQI